MKDANLARQRIVRRFLVLCLAIGPVSALSSYANDVENLGSLGFALQLLEAGQYDQAEPICQAFARQPVTSKESAEEAIGALRCLGTIEARRGNRAAIEALVKREVELHLRWKPDSRSTLYALIRHARIIERRSQGQESAAAWRRALDYGEANGVSDDSLVDVLQYLALHEHDAGNDAEALRLIERSINADRAFMGLNSTAAFLPGWIWAFLLEQGKDFEVDALHQAAIAYYEESGDSSTTGRCRLVEVLGNYYDFLELQGNSNKAGVIRRRIDDVRKELGTAGGCDPSAHIGPGQGRPAAGGR